jgi:hypothetical protein
VKKRRSILTPKLKSNWWIDASLGISAVLAVLSSIYFLIYPVTGYQGGRNPYYNKTLIFSKATWDTFHTWAGILMILAALVHIIIHWKWIIGTISRTWEVLTKKRDGFGARLTYNIVLDVTIAVSFILCSISGVYFLFNAESGPNATAILFTKTTWDLIHTWSGVIMTIGAMMHIVLHWSWITNITSKMFGSRRMISKTGQAALEPVKENA